MAKKGNNTTLIVALIFAMLVALVAIGLLIKNGGEFEKAKKKVDSSGKSVEAAKNQVTTLLKERDNAWKIISGKASPPGPYEAYQKGILKDARDTLDQLLSEEWVTEQDTTLIRDRSVANIWKELVSIKQNVQAYGGLKDLDNDLKREIKLLTHLIPQLQAIRAQKVQELEAAINQFEKDRARLNETIIEENEKLKTAKQKKRDDSRDFEKVKNDLVSELARLRKEHQDKAVQTNKQILALKAEVKKLLQRKREIRKKDKRGSDSAGADGEVVHADPELGFAWINLGKNDNLLPGMEFDVYRTVKGGRIKLKGRIIVKTVETTMAKATIVDGAKMVDPVTKELLTLPKLTDPIATGDLIRSSLFDKNEQQRFVFLGDKVANKIYRKEELKRKIEETGGKVDKVVGVNTNFVVLLIGAEENYPEEIEKAAQFGVIFMREKELLNYLTR